MEEATGTAGEETFAEKSLVKTMPEGCYCLRIVLILTSVLFLVVWNLNQRLFVTQRKKLLFFLFVVDSVLVAFVSFSAAVQSSFVLADR